MIVLLSKVVLSHANSFLRSFLVELKLYFVNLEHYVIFPWAFAMATNAVVFYYYISRQDIFL
jgi:hypothetical protein